MGGIGHHGYAGFSLAEKYGWSKSGPGAQAAIQVGDSLKRIAARLEVSDATIGAGSIERNLGTSWESDGASSFAIAHPSGDSSASVVSCDLPWAP